MTIRIEIIGPGGCIGYEVHAIVGYLRSKGASVTVEGEYPSPPPTPDAMNDSIASKEFEVKAVHLPWGG